MFGAYALKKRDLNSIQIYQVGFYLSDSYLKVERNMIYKYMYINKLICILMII